MAVEQLVGIFGVLAGDEHTSFQSAILEPEGPDLEILKNGSWFVLL